MRATTHSRYEPSPEAQKLYELAVEKMRPNGVIGPMGSLALTADGLKICGDLNGVTHAMNELIRASLVCPDEDENGWRVRLPLPQ